LKLTDEQFYGINENNQRFREQESDRYHRINELNLEIGTELEKPQPDRVYLGDRYREIESLCRQRQQPLAAHYRSNLGFLTEEQKAKLDGLDPRLRPVFAVPTSDSRFPPAGAH
jgi:hypothetical protein